MRYPFSGLIVLVLLGLFLWLWISKNKGMYFKHFSIGCSGESISKAGFQVNSYKNVNSYSERGEFEFSVRIPKDYIFQGNIWTIVGSSPLSERSFYLARTPLMPFEDLWNLFLHAENYDDRFGALALMYETNFSLLLQKYKEILRIDEPKKSEKRALKVLDGIMYDDFTPPN